MLYLKLIRANNWIKNVFILLPLFFSGELFNLTKLSNTILVMLLGFLSLQVLFTSSMIFLTLILTKTIKKKGSDLSLLGVFQSKNLL